MRRKKVLITGGSGYLGGYFINHFSSGDFDVYATYHNNRAATENSVRWLYWDMRNSLELADVSFDLVIHNAATLSCDPDTVIKYDIHSFFNLLPVVRNAYLIYISSMDVFNRNQTNLISEGKTLCPGNWYGFGKQSVESAIQLAGKLKRLNNYGIVRIPYVLSSHPKHHAGFWGRLINACRNRHEVHVRDIPVGQLDGYGFSWVDPADLANRIEELFYRNISGIFHVTNGFVTWEEFFKLISKLLKKNIRVLFESENKDGFYLLPDKRKLNSRSVKGSTDVKGKKKFVQFLEEMICHYKDRPERKEKEFLDNS